MKNLLSYRRARWSAGAALLLSLTSACDQTPLFGPPAVPPQIGQICFREQPDFTVEQVFQQFYAKTTAKDASWETNGESYIWRATLYNALEQKDVPVAVQFEAVDDFPNFKIGSCGRARLFIEAAIFDGQQLTPHDAGRLFGAAVDELKRQQQEASPPSEDVIEEIGSPAPPQTSTSPISENGEPVSKDWLVGTWGLAEYNPGNDPNASCETDAAVTFNVDGTYSDGGSYGRYGTDGKTITYFNSVLVDIGADTEDSSQFAQIAISRASKHAAELHEAGQAYRRCASS